MKKLITLLCSILLAGRFAEAQDNFLWLKLSDGRVVINGEFRLINDDTLFVWAGMRNIELPLHDVVRVRIVQSSTMVEGALLGAGAGFGVGTAVGFFARSNGPDTEYPIGTTMIFTVVGAVVGTVKTAFEKPEPIVDLNGKTNKQKRTIVEKLISQTPVQE